MKIIKCTHLGIAIAIGLMVLLAWGHAMPPLLADDRDRGYDKHDDGRHDHDRAFEAVKRGEVLPLEQVLAAVRSSIGGTVVRTKLERKRGAWVYELKVIDGDGRMREVYVDAKTSALLPDKKH